QRGGGGRDRGDRSERPRGRHHASRAPCIGGRGRSRAADRGDQPRACAARHEGCGRMVDGSRRRSGSVALRRRSQGQDRAGDGRRRRGHAAADARGLRPSGAHPDAGLDGEFERFGRDGRRAVRGSPATKGKSMSMNITIDWTVIVGLFGMIITLLAYFLLQAQKLHGNGLVYQMMNAVGALGVALSLLFGTFNLPAFLLEVIWLAISIYGIVVARRIRVQ